MSRLNLWRGTPPSNTQKKKSAVSGYLVTQTKSIHLWNWSFRVPSRGNIHNTQALNILADSSAQLAQAPLDSAQVLESTTILHVTCSHVLHVTESPLWLTMVVMFVMFLIGSARPRLGQTFSTMFIHAYHVRPTCTGSCERVWCRPARGLAGIRSLKLRPQATRSSEGKLVPMSISSNQMLLLKKKTRNLFLASTMGNRFCKPNQGTCFNHAKGLEPESFVSDS